jgi:hypothetical protein
MKTRKGNLTMKAKKEVVTKPNQDVNTNPSEEERIVLLQIVSLDRCTFACLKQDENDNKLELGVISR